MSLPTHCCGHTNKVANGVTELCGLWSKNIHSTWYQQFKCFAAHKGVVAPGFPCVSKTRNVSYDNMAHIILRNSSIIGCWSQSRTDLTMIKSTETFHRIPTVFVVGTRHKQVKRLYSGVSAPPLQKYSCSFLHHQPQVQVPQHNGVTL